METLTRTPTGIEGLDRLIGGGFLSGKVYLAMVYFTKGGFFVLDFSH